MMKKWSMHIFWWIERTIKRTQENTQDSELPSTACRHKGMHTGIQETKVDAIDVVHAREHKHRPDTNACGTDRLVQTPQTNFTT